MQHYWYLHLVRPLLTNLSELVFTVSMSGGHRGGNRRYNNDDRGEYNSYNRGYNRNRDRDNREPYEPYQQSSSGMYEKQ